MKTPKFTACLVAVCSVGLAHLAYAGDAFTNTTTTTAPPPAAGQDMYSNTTSTTAPPPASGQDMYSNTTSTTAPPPASGQDMYTNTTTTTAPPPAAGQDMYTNTTSGTAPPPAAGQDMYTNTTTTTAPPPPLSMNDANADATATTTATMPAPEANEPTEYADTHKLYRDMEFDLDVFGTLALGRHTIDHISTQRIYHNSQLGLGAGGTFYFCRYVGIGGEAYSANTTGSFVDSTSGNIYVRCPIEKIHLAPYAFGGGGYDFEGIKQGFGQAGIGLDCRIVKNFGVFVDARYVFASESHDYGVGRAGFRVAF